MPRDRDQILDFLVPVQDYKKSCEILLSEEKNTQKCVQTACIITHYFFPYFLLSETSETLCDCA